MLLWDGYGLQSTHSGIGRYALELGQQLRALGEAPIVLPSVPHTDALFKEWIAPLPHFKAGRIKPLSLWGAARQAESLISGKSGSHIFHGLSNYNIPKLSSSFRTVLTVHDLIPFLAPDAVSKALRIFMHFQLPRALEAVDRILCVSQWTADNLAAYHPAAASKISVVLNGRPEKIPRTELPRDKTKIKILSVSRGESYKRLHMIPAILKALPEHFEWHIVTQGEAFDRLANIPRLHRYQALSDEALNDLWATSSIFVHPSLWEGYCLPAATALSLGIPSVFTTGSGIDEVVGGAGVRMDALDTSDDWAAAIAGVGLDLSPWAERADRQWKRLPSWAEVAGQTQRVYATLVP